MFRSSFVVKRKEQFITVKKYHCIVFTDLYALLISLGVIRGKIIHVAKMATKR